MNLSSIKMIFNKNKASAMIGMALSLPAISGSVQAHGWAEFPSARQNTCYNDGGFWSNQIPNAACKEAHAVSGPQPFIQRNEVAALTKDYRNIEAVKANIPDGQLCSAGMADKTGLDVPSADWQTTDVVLDENGEFNFVWTATAPHNPSFWEFYLSKPSYDGLRPLTWDDLERVDTEENVEPTAGAPYKTYRFKVKLPQDRVGSEAVLYSRWQRIDPAGEGFYNCSDIVIKQGDGEVIPPPVEGNLTALYGYFVQPGLTAEAGDTARFRLMAGTSGSEVMDLRVDITAANQVTWATELASQINAQQPEKLFVGVWNAANGVYEFDNANLHANKVWVATDESYSFQVSIIKGEVEPPVEPPVEDGTWDKTATYVAGDEVTHGGKTWVAGWWTQGEEPGKAQVWKQVLGEGEVPSVEEWSSAKSYNESDVVTHNGDSWKAHWWTEGEEPGTTGEWGVWRKL